MEIRSESFDRTFCVLVGTKENTGRMLEIDNTIIHLLLSLVDRKEKLTLHMTWNESSKAFTDVVKRNRCLKINLVLQTWGSKRTDA
jgi:hypothetical protein